MDNKTNSVSGMGSVCFNRMAVRCLNVAPGKLSICTSSILFVGMRAKLESPVMTMGFVIGRDQAEALRLVWGCMRGR